MAKKYDLRLNIYLDENEPKDKILIDYLNTKYSAVGFIKETMYSLAIGTTVHGEATIQAIESEPLIKDDPEYEEIKGVSDIDM